MHMCTAYTHRFVVFVQGGRGDGHGFACAGRGTTESDSTALGELVSHMELVVVPPGCVLCCEGGMHVHHCVHSQHVHTACTASSPTASPRHARYLLYGEGAGDHEDSLLLVDSGFVSVYLGFVGAAAAPPVAAAAAAAAAAVAAGAAATGGAAASEAAAEAASQVAAEAAADVAAEAASARLRLAKVGPGFMLNVSNFVGRRGTRAGSEVAVADTFTQLLRLSRARFDLLEASSPALACQLYRLLVQCQQEAVDDYRMAEVTSSAFKVAVKPSASLANFLSAGAPEGAAVAAQSARVGGGSSSLRGCAKTSFARSTRSARQGKSVPRQLQKLERFQLLLDQGRATSAGAIPASRSSDCVPSSRTMPSLPSLSHAMSRPLTLPASSTAAAGEVPRSGKMPRTWSSDSIASEVEQHRNRRLNPRRPAPGSTLPSIPPSPRVAATPGKMVAGFDRVGGNKFVLSGVDSDASTDSDDSGNSFYFDSFYARD
tara:strand:- start:301 stop:1761 length:1461 start_codon:yes stop_codon:yes gene_type:complete